MQDYRLIEYAGTARQCIHCQAAARWRLEKNYGGSNHPPIWASLLELCDDHRPADEIQARIYGLGMTPAELERFVGECWRFGVDSSPVLQTVFKGLEVRFSFSPWSQYVAPGEAWFLFSPNDRPGETSCRMQYRLKEGACS